MKDTPNYYAIIPANVRYDSTLKANEKLLYGEITALASQNGECWANNSYFANLYDATKETISRWIGNLYKKGYIEVVMTYKNGTKEIEKRAITPIDKKINTYCQKNQEGIDEKIKENNTSINNNICPSNDAQDSPIPIKSKEEQEKELADNFDKIWKLYPRKDGKNTAFTHYKSWLKGKKYAGRTIKLTNKQMWLATKKYANLMEENKTEKQYIKMGSTFFNEAIMEYVEVKQNE